MFQSTIGKDMTALDRLTEDDLKVRKRKAEQICVCPSNRLFFPIAVHTSFCLFFNDSVRYRTLSARGFYYMYNGDF
jgi:hypothetical protein